MVDEKIIIILLLAWVVFGIVLAVIDSKREVNKMRLVRLIIGGVRYGKICCI